MGSFPGLGSVRVHPDGKVDVTTAERPEDDHDTVEQREHALLYGWGEPLSFARRGFRLAHGGAAAPLDGDACLLVLGDPHDVAIVIIELVQLGWGVLGDRPTPLEWDGLALTAHPRSAPIVASKRRATKAGLAGTQLRGDTDAVALDLPRIRAPRRVAAVVSMQMRKPDEDAFTLLTGHQRFETAAGLFMRGALWPQIDVDSPDEGMGDDEVAADAMADHLALARLPAARLRFDSATKDDDVADLLAWWLTVVGSS